jgi:hypothetical protein
MSAHLQCGCGPGNTPCGCCEGVEVLTPLSVANRPGLGTLTYRVGDHATFFETMVARLSTMKLEHDGEELSPLRELTTRELDDPSIALLDGWAMVADVLTFYQERIANEGYLRTATERRSIIELARLVGYRLRPGVAASVWLALTIEKDEKVAIEPYEVRAQSVPGPGELPQSFENIEKIEARGRWNKLGPRLTQPQDGRALIKRAAEFGVASLYLKGIATGLNPNDLLLVAIANHPALFRVVELNADTAAYRTEVEIEPWIGAVKTTVATTPSSVSAMVSAFVEPGVAASHLEALNAEIASGKSEAELAEFLQSETLPALERVIARRNISNLFRDRVRMLSKDLSGAAASLRKSGTSITGQPRLSRMALADGATIPITRVKDVEDKTLRAVLDGLTKAESVPPRNALRLGRDAVTTFTTHSDLGIQAIGAFVPTLLDSLPIALGSTSVTTPAVPEVYAFRVKASLFGHNAPQHSKVTTNDKTSTVDFTEWTVREVLDAEDFFDEVQGTVTNKLSKVVYLDGSFDKVQSKSWVVVDTSAINTDELRKLELISPPVLIARAAKPPAVLSRSAYSLSGKATRIELAVQSGAGDAPWLQSVNKDTKTNEFQIIRRTVVYAQAELLELTEQPIKSDICTKGNDWAVNVLYEIGALAVFQNITYKCIEPHTSEVGLEPPNATELWETDEAWIVLDGIYSELKSGRWVVVEGERADVLDGFGDPVLGIKGTELAMLAEVVHKADPRMPGDNPHTRVKFSANLEYCYLRDEVTIYANVVKATHGETRKETLGSGDGSKSLQQFALKQPPLTYVSAPTPSGVESTLKMFVNDVEWHEAESIFGLSSTARRFVATRNDAEVTTAVFGNGKQGARLPTGTENIRAQYRQGIGKGGNVAAGKISLLAARPLNVKEVINPQRASGGADAETRDQARKNAPVAVLALDRLVSTSDYADFARTFGGVGKAYSIRLSDGIRELVHVTIAGFGDAPIDEGSDLLRNLRRALTDFGDPQLPVAVAVRELQLLVVSAKVRLLPDYVWEKVAPKIRTKMLDTFSFEARELGQDVFLSEVMSAMQSVPGVSYVDVDALDGIAERNPAGLLRTPNELIGAAQGIAKPAPAQRVPVNLPEISKTSADPIRPAQIAYLAPEIPDTLILNLIE